MTQDEALKTIQTINKECDEHDICQECPVWSNEHNECLMDLFCYGENGKSKIKDSVNQPAHYLKGGMECIDEMVLVFGKEATAHFCLCNVWKYRRRALYKNGEEDMQKSHFYLNKYKELIEK